MLSSSGVSGCAPCLRSKSRFCFVLKLFPFLEVLQVRPCRVQVLLNFWWECSNLPVFPEFRALQTLTPMIADDVVNFTLMTSIWEFGKASAGTAVFRLVVQKSRRESVHAQNQFKGPTKSARMRRLFGQPT